MTKKHILLHGFGSFPLTFKALIEYGRAIGDDSIEWSIACTTGHYVEMYKNLLGEDAVLYLNADVKNHLNRPDLLDQLSDYSGNIYRNIESEKRYTKHKKSMRQLRSAAAMYCSLKAFVTKRQPTHILFGNIEGMDGMTLISVAKELGIKALVPSHTRHLGGTFFSPDHLETLPESRNITDADKAKAKAFLQKYRQGNTRAAGIPDEITQAPLETYPVVKKPFAERVMGFIKRLVDEPEMREPDLLRASLFVNFPMLANMFWKTRGAINKRIYDVSSLEQLPQKFAYYPLQYSPESSINTPAPYFVDQLRAIDAIRFALPSDTFLVIKEHPACIELRPVHFIKSLQKKAGVIIARHDISSDDIQSKAEITFSVTGTSTFESFLKKRPALTLGGAFFNEFLGGMAHISTLPQRIKQALETPISDDDILDALANIYAVSGPFILGCPFDKDSCFSNYALNKVNIENFYRHLMKEISIDQKEV